METQSQIDALKDKTDLIYKSATVPRDVETAFRERLNPPVIIEGSGAPASVPKQNGSIYIDATNGKVYIAKGMSTSADWAEVTNAASASISARSYNPSNISIGTGADVKLLLTTNDFANGVTWTAGSNRLVIVTPGVYMVTAMVTYTNSTSAKTYQVEIFKNGSTLIASEIVSAASGAAVGPNVSDIQTFAANDYLELYTFHNTGGNSTISASTTATYLSLAKV